MPALQFPASPVNGQAFQDYVYDASRGVWNVQATQQYIPFEYLVIAGGGAGGTGSRGGPGGGAGGYRSSVVGESSGGGASAEPVAQLYRPFTVTIGAGGATANASGSNSQLGDIVSIGGGGAYNPGGSGGGWFNGNLQPYVPGAKGTPGQGYDGGAAAATPNTGQRNGGGGGGAGAVGGTPANPDIGAPGGIGVESSITGVATYRAGGGGGRGDSGGGVGGLGGGGTTDGGSGVANTGGGGAGSQGAQSQGGSGVVIVKYPAIYTLTPGVGLTHSTTTVGSYKVTEFTAGSDDVTVGV